jgi:hypothetical protein
MRDFHCCATCRHFKAEKKEDGMSYTCTRLGFVTKSSYKFNCWNPKENIKKLIELNKNKMESDSQI